MELGVAGEAWIKQEIDLAIELYLDLFQRSARGESFIKAREFKRLSDLLQVRTPGSVELKMCNISSVFVGLGWPHIPGLGPMPNIQRELVPRVIDALDAHPSLDAAAWRLINKSVDSKPVDLVYSDSAPQIIDLPRGLGGSKAHGVKRNYIEIEARNSALGLAGELAVLALEERRLRSLGAGRLAERIEHVSSTKGDGLGYDIHSYEANGRDKYIEVKTTIGSRNVPFFVTNRELQVSQETPDEYSLARVYDFPAPSGAARRKSGVYELRGALDQTCVLTPDNYRAVPALQEKVG